MGQRKKATRKNKESFPTTLTRVLRLERIARRAPDADPPQSVPNNKSLCNKSRPFEQVGNFRKFSSFSAASWQWPAISQWGSNR